jgi:hypothetical protein
MIDAADNTLLHVDQHSDMAAPRFYTSLKTLEQGLPALCSFTYHQLSIANFIVAAVYQGLFNELYWLQHQKLKAVKTLHVFSHQQAGQALRLTADLHEAGMFNPDRKSATYALKTVYDEFSSGPALVLDIDLDYFSCEKEQAWESPHGSRVEISQAEYERFNADRYHPLRINFGGVKSQVEQGRYYLLVNAFPEVIPSKLKVSQEQILQRMDQFEQFLRANNFRPRLINICRSRFSGFTPQDQWEFIEQELLNRLGAMYELDLKTVDELLAEEQLAI